MTLARRAPSAPTPAPPPSRRTGARVALVVGGVVLGLALAEAGLRVLDWARSLGPSDLERRLAESEAAAMGAAGNFSLFGMVRASPYRDVVYELKPGLEGLFRNRPLTTNRWGMRGPEVERRKPRGVFRIAGVGDSHMFGWGVGQGETFMDRAGELLNRRLGGAPRIETLNFAVPGYNTALEAALLERRALDFEPDLVVVHFHTNDFKLPPFLQPPEETLRRRRSVLFDLGRSAVGLPPPDEVPDLYTPDMDDVEATLAELRRRYRHTAGREGFLAGFDRIARAAGARGLPVVVLLLNEEDAMRRYVAGEARARGFEVVDARPYFRDRLARTGAVSPERWREVYALPRDQHPSAEAHAAYAEALAGELIERGLVPAPPPAAAPGGAGPSADRGRPLLEVAPPSVLVESANLGRPTARQGSRFLSGWAPLGRGPAGGPPAYRMGSTATLELVALGPAPGAALAPAPALTLRLAGDSPRGGRIAVEVAGRAMGSVAIADPLRIPLPTRLARGRTTVRLEVEEGEPPVVARGALQPAPPSGAVSLEGGAVVLAGRSEAEFLLPAAAGLALTGRFVPPAATAGDASFRATLDRVDGAPGESLVWTPGPGSRLPGARAFRLAVAPPADPGARFVRLRLEARGDGGAARWEDLRVFGTPPDGAASAAAELAPGATRPRLVIVYVMDALRADHVGVLAGGTGDAADRSATPTWDRLAGEGLLLANHRATAPNTLPSSKALFVGRPYVVAGGGRLRPDDGPTLAERFRSAGYRTGLFSANVFLGPAYATDRGFEVAPAETLFVDDAAHNGPGPRINDSAERVQGAALAWLDGLPPGSSAFLYLHTLHPHSPYAPPEPLRSRYAPAAAPLAAALDGATSTLLGVQSGDLPLDARGRRYLGGLYRGSVAHSDAVLADFLPELARRVPPEETLLAVTSDHGEELFDHGGVLHGYTLYEELLRIPLVVWAPGRIAPRRVEAPTDTIDLHDLLVRLLAPPGRGPQPLLLARDPDVPRFAAASTLKGGIFAVQNRRWKVVWAPRTGLLWGVGDGIGRGRDAEQWFRLDRDPGESVNRVGDADPEARWLRARLFAWIDGAGGAEERRAGGAAAAEGGPPDARTARALRTLGYLE
jgi:arylsulfatase A-like enzyme